MNADLVRVLALALCCAAALLFAAGTIADPVAVDDEEEGGGIVGGDGPAGGAAGDADPGLLSPLDSPGLEFCFPVLDHPLVVLGLIALWVGVATVFVRYAGFVVGSVGALAVLLPGFVVHATVSTCGGEVTGNEQPVANGSTNVTGAAGNASSGNASPLGGYQDPSQLEWLLPFLLVIGVLLVAAVAAREWGDDEEDRLDEDPVVTAAPAALAREAGRAADRIESATDVDNEVYRAWAEMTTHVDVEGPETSTPREFAAAATEAGLASDHVDELTEVFEEVRYGGASPTDDLESRAVEALRRIEAAYGADDGGEP